MAKTTEEKPFQRTLTRITMASGGAYDVVESREMALDRVFPGDSGGIYTGWTFTLYDGRKVALYGPIESITTVKEGADNVA